MAVTACRLKPLTRLHYRQLQLLRVLVGAKFPDSHPIASAATSNSGIFFAARSLVVKAVAQS